MNNKKNENIAVGRGCSFNEDPETHELKAESVDGCHKLHTYNWTENLENGQNHIFEIRFKNTRKGFYENVNNLSLKRGDIVAVESSPGHDIGIVSLTGDMVGRQMRTVNFDSNKFEFKKIYRKAKPYDIEKWQESIALEHSTMIRSRQITSSLGLDMKIGDVEYQGDRIKAIFYYIADTRIDFRALIKFLADEFKIRVEMKQIGARQEAGRIGGIGGCGRELCCSTWVTNFVSVTTNAARHQEILLNPQKLAGQCGKLKCCLNFEVDSYIDARKNFPKLYQPLETSDATYYLVKSDIFKREMSFSSEPNSMVNLITIPVDRAREVMFLNKKGVKPEQLSNVVEEKALPDYRNVIGDDSITRFDKKAKPKAKRKPKFKAKDDSLNPRQERPEKNGDNKKLPQRPRRPIKENVTPAVEKHPIREKPLRGRMPRQKPQKTDSKPSVNVPNADKKVAVDGVNKARPNRPNDRKRREVNNNIKPKNGDAKDKVEPKAQPKPQHKSHPRPPKKVVNKQE
ncbi:MAG: hypothetical protein IMY73_05360 [Bacteroidetes bacterium]|nr:hypothetical protein [Bacteroidota bacterium]